MEESGHKNLEVWNRAISFVTRVYEVTRGFPREELYGLVSQLRRSATSIPSNIAEGSTRSSTKEYLKFLYVALSSASEIDVQLIISKNLNYLAEEVYYELSGEREEISRMISGQIRALKTKL